MITLRAELEPRQESGNRRHSARRKLRLTVDGSSAGGSSEALIHDLSVTGLLIETAADLNATDTIEVDLPLAGKRSATVVWNSANLFGCHFLKPISPGAVSAALLQTPFETVAAAMPGASAAGVKMAPETATSPAKESSARKLWALVGWSMVLWALIGFAAWLVLFR